MNTPPGGAKIRSTSWSAATVRPETAIHVRKKTATSGVSATTAATFHTMSVTTSGFQHWRNLDAADLSDARSGVV